MTAWARSPHWSWLLHYITNVISTQGSGLFLNLIKRFLQQTFWLVLVGKAQILLITLTMAQWQWANKPKPEIKAAKWTKFPKPNQVYFEKTLNACNAHVMKLYISCEQGGLFWKDDAYKEQKLTHPNWQVQNWCYRVLYVPKASTFEHMATEQA